MFLINRGVYLWRKYGYIAYNVIYFNIILLMKTISTSKREQGHGSAVKQEAKRGTSMVRSLCIVALCTVPVIGLANPSSGSRAPMSIETQIAQTRSVKVTGTIKEAKTGEPIVGANIQIKGTQLGGTTDLDGRFTLLKVEPNATLIISSIGMKTIEVRLNGRTQLELSMEEDAKALQDLVVVGYGKMKKGDLSAAVSSISNVGELQTRPISSAEEMLQGQIPGVTVISNGGHPDSKPTITIRGMGSRSNESPLYVVDGVPGAPFNFSDVVSMTVLKDAASAAIYGAYAGSAGVILVTTKQAEAGKTSLEYSVVGGISTATNLPQSLTIDEERRVRAFALGGEEYLPEGWNPEKNPYISQTRTDWMAAIFRNAPFQRHNIALSGGTETFSNRLSAELSNRQGTLISTYNKEFTLRLNSSYKFNKYIRIREDLSWKNSSLRGTNTSSAESGVILSALMMPRNAEVRDHLGGYGGTAPSDPEYISKYKSNYADIHGDAINPVRTLEADANENNRDQLTSSTFFDIMEPIKGLNFISRFTYKLENYFYKGFSPRRIEPGKPNPRNSLSYNSSRSVAWDWENTLTYDRVFGRHNLGLMASTTASEYRYRGFGVTGREFASEAEALRYFAQAQEFDPAKDSYLLDRNFSVVGRASYSWSDRYFATLSMRRDYAGRLPQGKKYGDFPSATLAWKLTSEPWMPKSEYLNLLKLRASWGKIGNLGSIPMGYAYPTLTNFAGNDVGVQVGKNAPILTGKYNSSGFNPMLTWETSEQLDFGLDMELLENRLHLTVDYFIKDTKNLIKPQDAGWTKSIGLAPQLINEGIIHNSGLEVSASWTDKVGSVTYWLNANMATLKNKVKFIGEANAKGEKPVWTDGSQFKDLRPYRTEEGMPLYSFWLVDNDGVFMNQGEIDAHVSKDGTKIQPNAEVGDLRFVDQNGDGKITSEDRIYMGNAMPKLTYSLSGGLSWRGFTFSMMLQGVSGVNLFNAYKYTTLNETIGSFNRSREILKALDGPNALVPRISAKDKNANFTTNSDYYLESGDYLRIKNLSLGYSFGSFIKGIQGLDLTLSVDNLATFTKYTGIDPEVGGIGFDAGQYPVSRTMSLALKLKF